MMQKGFISTVEIFCIYLKKKVSIAAVVAFQFKKLQSLFLQLKKKKKRKKF